MDAKLWMEVLRLVDNHPGINVTELLKRLDTTFKHNSRLVLMGYLRCMEDCGLLSTKVRPNMVELYTNGSSPSLLIKEFQLFQEMLAAKHKRLRKQGDPVVHHRQHNPFIRNEDGSVGEEE